MADAQYTPSTSLAGLSISPEPESVTQATGLENIGASTVDPLVGFTTDSELEYQRATELLSKISQPSMPSGVRISPTGTEGYVGGYTFDPRDPLQLAQAEKYFSRADAVPEPEEVRGWQYVDPSTISDRLAALRKPRTTLEDIGVGTRDLAAGAAGLVGRLPELMGAPETGRYIAESIEGAVGPTPEMKARTALIEQNNTIWQSIRDNAARGLPSLAGVFAGGLAGFALGGHIGAFAGAGLVGFGLNLKSTYDTAKERGFDVENPATQNEILQVTIGLTALDSLVPGRLASGALKAAAAEAGGKVINRVTTRGGYRETITEARSNVMRRVAAGALQGGYQEAITEAAQEILQNVAFDKDFRNKLSQGELKALVPLIAERYGRQVVIAMGAGGLLGAGAGGIAGIPRVKGQEVGGETTDLTTTAEPTPEPGPEAGPTAGLTPPSQALPEVPAGVVTQPPAPPSAAAPAPSGAAPTPPSTAAQPAVQPTTAAAQPTVQPTAPTQPTAEPQPTFEPSDLPPTDPTPRLLQPFTYLNDTRFYDSSDALLDYVEGYSSSDPDIRDVREVAATLRSIYPNQAQLDSYVETLAPDLASAAEYLIQLGRRIDAERASDLGGTAQPTAEPQPTTAAAQPTVQSTVQRPGPATGADLMRNKLDYILSFGGLEPGVRDIANRFLEVAKTVDQMQPVGTGSSLPDAPLSSLDPRLTPVAQRMYEIITTPGGLSDDMVTELNTLARDIAAQPTTTTQPAPTPAEPTITAQSLAPTAKKTPVGTAAAEPAPATDKSILDRLSPLGYTDYKAKTLDALAERIKAAGYAGDIPPRPKSILKPTVKQRYAQELLDIIDANPDLANKLKEPADAATQRQQPTSNKLKRKTTPQRRATTKTSRRDSTTESRQKQEADQAKITAAAPEPQASGKLLEVPSATPVDPGVVKFLDTLMAPFESPFKLIVSSKGPDLGDQTRTFDYSGTTLNDYQRAVLRQAAKERQNRTSLRGYLQYFGSAAHLSITGDMPALQQYLTASHEFGHLLKSHFYAKAPKELKAALDKDWKEFLKRTDPALYKKLMKEDLPVGEFYAAIKPLVAVPYRLAAVKKAMKIDSSDPATKISEQHRTYLRSFDEWFADNVARWATTRAEPLSLVEKFFMRLATEIRKLHTKLTGKYKDNGEPAPSIEEFIKFVYGPDGVSAEPTAQTPGAAPQQTQAEVETEPETAPEPAIFSEEESTPAETKRDIRDYVNENVPEPLREQASSIATTIVDLSKKGLYGMSFGRQLVRMIKDKLPSAQAYFDQIFKQNAIGSQLIQEVGSIMDAAKGLSQPLQDRTMALLKDMTVQQKWAKRYAFTPKDAKIDKTLELRYNALRRESPLAANTIDKMLKHMYDSRMRMRAAIRNAIEAPVREAVKELADLQAIANPTAAQRNRIDALNDVIAERRKEVTRQFKLLDTAMPMLSGPYMPLSRFGKYVTVAKSKAYRALERIPRLDRTPEDRAALEEMRASADDYIVIFADSLGQAKQYGDKIKADNPGMTVESYERQQFGKTLDSEAWAGLQRLRALVQDDLKDVLTTSERDQVNQLVQDLYISSLAENSARRNNLARKGVAGASDDMFRAFVTKGRADAHFIASLENSEAVTDALLRMKKEAELSNDELEGTGATGDRADRMRAYIEVVQRHVQGMAFAPTPVQDRLLAFNSVWTLFTLPRYYIQNALQTYMLSMPVMAATYGYGKSSRAITAAYQDISKVIGADVQAFMRGEFDIQKLKGKKDSPFTDAEIDFLQAQRDNGLIDIGIAYDLGVWETSKESYKLSKAMSKAVNVMTTAVRQIEVLNRVSAGLAAYRLATKSGKKASTAAKYAEDILTDTQGDYNWQNAPRYFTKVPAGKVVLQFRKYQLIQASLLIGNFYKSFKGATPEEKAVAQRTLAFVLGQTAVMTGALGLPGVALTAYILGSIFGEEEEPVNAERTLRRLIGNEDLANVLLRGVPNAGGIDAHAYFGFNTAFSPLPYTDVDLTTREGYYKTLVGLAGPLAGTGSMFADGLSYMARGDYYKGIERMMPSGLRQGMRSYRETIAEGVTTRGGDQLVSPDEFNTMQTVLQAMGFPSTELSRIRRARQDLYEFNKYFSRRTTEIRKDYVEARKNRDVAGQTKAREEWRALQDAKRRVGLKPSAISNLASAPKQQQTRERKAQEEFLRIQGAR